MRTASQILASELTEADKIRFFSKINTSDNSTECHIWKDSKSHRGYGWFSMRGKGAQAHRIAFALANGSVAAGMCICHRCDNPSCVNPAHLFEGDQGVNVRDMFSKSRVKRPQGSAHGMSRLTESQVVAIRDRRKGGETLKSLARVFGVDASLISLIALRKIWKHI
jgi:hypothetical protein